jgi:hypothetical protein
MQSIIKGPDAETADPAWKSLYIIGAAAALIMVAMYLISMPIYFSAYSKAPPPANVLEWFTLFQNDWITGLFFLGLADIVINIAWLPVSLALFAALKHANKSLMAVATAFVFVGVTAYFASNIAFAMLSLSHQYAAATTEAQRSLLLAAGQALIAVSQGTGVYVAALVSVAALIMSVVMLRSKVFGKLTAYIGILGFALLLLGVPFSTYTTVSPTGPGPVVTAIIAIQYAGGGILSMVWYFLIGRRLLQLGRSGEKKLI